MTAQNIDSNGDERSVVDSQTCIYEFDPSRETDAQLKTTWECPHQAHAESQRCIFHMDADERKACDVTEADLIDRIHENLMADSQRVNEYVGADLPYLSMTYQDIDGETNHVLNFQYADIDGIDLTHGTFEQGLNLREATIGTLKFDNAEFTSRIEADNAVVDGAVRMAEATFEGDVRFPGAVFRAEVICDETTFGADTDFSAATFQQAAKFRATEARGTSHELKDHLTFREATFRDEATFRQSTFGYVMFRGASFHERAEFEQVAFDGNTNFQAAVFRSVAQFDDSVFDDDATFQDARFDARACFPGCRFNGGSRATNDDVTFAGATFGADATFKLAQFRYLNLTDTTFEGDLDCDRAIVDERADCHDVTVAGVTSIDQMECSGPVSFEDGTFSDRFVAAQAEFDGDVSFQDAAFAGEADFDEVQFREDAHFQAATFRDVATFRGANFEGTANHVDANASFKSATFEDDAVFDSAAFVTASFWDVTVFAGCSFRDTAFDRSGQFRIETGDREETVVDFTDATITGGVISEGEEMVPYDLTRATLGEVRLEGQSNQHELLDYFRFCLTDFDRFDFTNHNAYLERNDWNIHTFVADDAIGKPAVEMRSDVIEETYRRAQEAADTIGANDAKRGFEFRRWYYNRQKNWDMVFHEYSLNALTRAKKFASILLNLFFQYTCGYGNRVPRIFASMGAFTLLYGVLFTLGGPFETQAGVIFESGNPETVLFDAIYYSGISFTTIGYGDIGPVGWAAKLLAASEGYLSAIMFTLLTVTLLRSAIGSS